MVSPSHAPNPMERVEETAHPRGKPGTPRNQTSNRLAMGHDQQSLLADSEITHSPPGPTHEILANPRFVISPRGLPSLQDNLTDRRMRDPHVRWCERRAGNPGPPTRLLDDLRRAPHLAVRPTSRCAHLAARPLRRSCSKSAIFATLLHFARIRGAFGMKTRCRRAAKARYSQHCCTGLPEFAPRPT